MRIFGDSRGLFLFSPPGKRPEEARNQLGEPILGARTRLAVLFILINNVRSDTVLRLVMHLLSAYLYLQNIAGVGGHGRVDGFIAVGLGKSDVVLHPFG